VVDAAGGASTSMISLGDNIDSSKGDGEAHRESDSFDYYSEDFEKMENDQLQDLKQELEYLVESEPEMSKFKEQVLLNITTEGLVIQIIDKENRPMFDLGSAVLKSYARRILSEMAPILNELPNKLSISGHTDAKKFFRRGAYSNWELSSDRANAARRQLVLSKVPQEKIIRVVGLASKFLLYKDKPHDPGNRRISILVLKKRIEDNMYRDMGLKPEGGLPEPIIEKLNKVFDKPKKISTKKEVQNEIRGGTIRRSGSVVRFRGD